MSDALQCDICKSFYTREEKNFKGRITKCKIYKGDSSFSFKEYDLCEYCSSVLMNFLDNGAMKEPEKKYQKTCIDCKYNIGAPVRCVNPSRCFAFDAWEPKED